MSYRILWGVLITLLVVVAGWFLVQSVVVESVEEGVAVDAEALRSAEEAVLSFLALATYNSISELETVTAEQLYTRVSRRVQAGIDDNNLKSELGIFLGGIDSKTDTFSVQAVEQIAGEAMRLSVVGERDGMQSAHVIEVRLEDGVWKIDTIETTSYFDEDGVVGDLPPDTTEPPQRTPPPPVSPQPSEPAPATTTVSGACFVGGCSGQMCTDDSDGAISTCEWREEYACYRTATCERQASGECGWTPTESLLQCLAQSNASEQ